MARRCWYVLLASAILLVEFVFSNSNFDTCSILCLCLILLLSVFDCDHCLCSIFHIRYLQTHLHWWRATFFLHNQRFFISKTTFIILLLCFNISRFIDHKFTIIKYLVFAQNGVVASTISIWRRCKMTD